MCEDCRALLDISEHQYCLCEKNPLRLPPEQKKHGKCLKCYDKKLSGLYFALSYKEKQLTKKLIYQFKYQPYIKDLAKTLAGILIEHFIISKKNTDDIWDNGILMPVPLDKKKLKARGYNQSEELAKELAKILKIPLILDNLIKIKPTPSQIGLSKEEREKNLLNAFAINPVRNAVSNGVNKNCAISEIAQFSGKKVFLVDDVYTTGSTMEECAFVLRNSGAKSVWGICIAREG